MCAETSQTTHKLALLRLVLLESEPIALTLNYVNVEKSSSCFNKKIVFT